MTSISRRNLLRAGVAGGVAGALFEAPAFSSAALRPLLTHGVQSGAATADSAIIWSRADRPARLWVQASRRPDPRGARLIRGPIVTPDIDFTGKVRLRDLPSDSKIYYRVRAESLDRPGLFGSSLSGSLSTSPVRRKDVRFVWIGDVAGQGWGIDPAYGGMKIFESMRQRRPDFLLHSGDSIYADGPIVENVTLPDGRIYHNVVTEAKSKGPVYRKISHGPLLDLFILDMRTFKDPNDANTYADPRRGMLGREQREWLIRGLRQSRATWKVIANDLPLGLVVPDTCTPRRSRTPRRRWATSTSARSRSTVTRAP
jgi:phosphodiesterase/alkaline phosphatase D-like protein